VLTMAKRQEDLDAGVQRMLAMAEPGVFEVTRGVTRPVWEPDAGCLELVTLAERLHSEVGLPFRHESSGGGSDGNFTGAMGIPTLDGLGVDGDKFHTLEEHIVVDSLASQRQSICGNVDGHKIANTLFYDPKVRALLAFPLLGETRRSRHCNLQNPPRIFARYQRQFIGWKDGTHLLVTRIGQCCDHMTDAGYIEGRRCRPIEI